MTIPNGFSGVWALLVLAPLLFLSSCVIVHHGERATASESSAESGEFDSAGYETQNWQSKVLPELKDHAVDIRLVLKGLEVDPEAARSQWGHRQEETAPYSFIVTGSAAVKAVDLESAAATAEVDLAAPAEGAKVLVQIGPVIRSSAIRDSLSFVHFGDFTNQVDFANLSRALNSHVKTVVLEGLDRDHLVGKTLKFTGAFVEAEDGTVLITPAVLEVAP